MVIFSHVKDRSLSKEEIKKEIKKEVEKKEENKEVAENVPGQEVIPFFQNESVQKDNKSFSKKNSKKKTSH